MHTHLMRDDDSVVFHRLLGVEDSVPHTGSTVSQFSDNGAPVFHSGPPKAGVRESWQRLENI